MVSNYNPDVLSCLANLSNDEVFTPPELANKILDMLPAELWSDKSVKFLDPVCKSGVFLREIAKRLIVGLEKEFPDKQERINHIYKNQLFGIAITELTALLSRRSVYCSKTANGKYSVCDLFETEEGNIIFDKTDHSWVNGRCILCGASETVYTRDDELESHAYKFIHTKNPGNIFNMKFDVIIGNPPYQLNDGGGTGASAIPIYHKFVEQAKKLNPNFLIMIIPSRWFTGGRGLDEFRDDMLNDRRIKILHDYWNASDCFPGVEIKGGVCYFLWDKNYNGKCQISSYEDLNQITESVRYLMMDDSVNFIRYNRVITIIEKINKLNENKFSDIVSANDPFGFDQREEDSYRRVKPNLSKVEEKGYIRVYYFGWQREGERFIALENIRKNQHLIDSYKLFIPKAWGSGFLGKDWLKPISALPKSACTETYLVVGPFNAVQQMENVYSYTQTKFFHLLVGVVKLTQNAMKKAYSFVPIQDFNEPWTDEKLYKKYGLTQEEIDFIESMIRPMELGDEK
jgi:site-specific DNA-methyltransferase (adenine-specific)